MSDYRELIFYQKAQRLVQGCDKLIEHWPRSMKAQEISRQLFRSAISIGANISEGHGRYVGSEYARFLIIAQASANETDHWLHTSRDVGLGPVEEIESLIELNTEVRKMLSSTIKTIRRKQI